MLTAGGGVDPFNFVQGKNLVRNAPKEDFGLKSILLEELEGFRGSCKPPKSQSFSPRSGKGYAEPGELEFLDGWCSEGFFFKVLVGRPPPQAK